MIFQVDNFQILHPYEVERDSLMGINQSHPHHGPAAKF